MNKQHTHGRAHFASFSDVMPWRVWKLRTLARKHFSIRLPLSIIRTWFSPLRVKKEPASMLIYASYYCVWRQIWHKRKKRKRKTEAKSSTGDGKGSHHLFLAGSAWFLKNLHTVYVHILVKSSTTLQTPKRYSTGNRKCAVFAQNYWEAITWLPA